MPCIILHNGTILNLNNVLLICPPDRAGDCYARTISGHDYEIRRINSDDYNAIIKVLESQNNIFRTEDIV